MTDANGVAAAIEADLLDGIILEIVIVIIDYLILLVATSPQLFLSNNPISIMDHG